MIFLPKCRAFPVVSENDGMLKLARGNTSFRDSPDLIADNLSLSKHIHITTIKANQTLGFLKRNIRVHSKDLKSSVAYKTLVRPQLEYGSTVWYPHTTIDINKVEAVQRRAARWASRYYRYTSSGTAMLKDLNWPPLDQRRIDSRLLMMYKVTYDLVAIPASDYLVRNARAS